MKRFTIYGFVFVLVCGQYMNGVQGEISDASGVKPNPKCINYLPGNICIQCQDGYFLDAKKQCQSPNHNDTFPIVKAVPGHHACGAINKTLKVNGFTYGLTSPSSTYCQHICQSRADCTHFVYDYKNIMRLDCWIVTRLNFGIKKINVVTGPPVCPSKDYCLNPNVKYDGDGATSITLLNISSPQACQKNCSGGISVAFTYDTKSKNCYCKDNNYFRIVSDANYVSGDVVCPDCFKHHHDLSLLPNIDNGGPYPYLTVNSAVECQKHCNNNSLCTVFEFDPSKNQCRLKNEKTVETDEDSVAYISRNCDISCTCNQDGLKPGINRDCNPLGDCICNEQEGYTGKHCSKCKDGYRKEGTICKKCGCNVDGAINKTCTANGECFCKPEHKKPTCNECVDGAYRGVNKKTCQMCNCNVGGSITPQCNVNGTCTCRHMYGGDKCNSLIVRTINLGNLTKGDSYIVRIDCYWKCSWKILKVGFAPGGNMDIQGASGPFYKIGSTINTKGFTFCSGLGYLSNRNPETCIRKGPIRCNAKSLYLWLLAKYSSNNVVFTYQVPNAKAVNVTKEYPPQCPNCKDYDCN